MRIVSKASVFVAVFGVVSMLLGALPYLTSPAAMTAPVNSPVVMDTWAGEGAE